jgi:hypothetical protein
MTYKARNVLDPVGDIAKGRANRKAEREGRIREDNSQARLARSRRMRCVRMVAR